MDTVDKKYSYDKDLWDGTKIVFDHFEEGRKTIADCMKLLDSRGSLEGECSKKLAGMAAKQANTPESRSLGSAWLGIKQYHESVSKGHQQLSVMLSKTLVNELKSFNKEMVKQRDHFQKSIQNLNDDKAKKSKALNNAKTVFHQKSEVHENALLNYEKAQQDPLCNTKNLNKLNSAVKKAQKEADSQDNIYKSNLQEFQSFQVKYEDSMKTILKEFQMMEERRTVFLKDIFEKFVAAQEALINEMNSQHKQLVSSVASINGLQDVQDFVGENKTGLQPEKPAEYVPYPWKHKNLQKKVEGGKESKSKKKGSKKKAVTASVPVATQKKEPVRQVREEKVAVAAPVAQAAKPEATVKAKTLYEYTAAEDNELSFQVGEIITVTKQDASGWWEGVNANGESGMFPGNYCEVIDDVRRCRVKFGFTAENDDELTITEGEIIVIDSQAEGWFEGTNDRGESGLFPANYCELLD